jgi:tetratricopeptide (TPR) repeat protein
MVRIVVSLSVVCFLWLSGGAPLALGQSTQDDEARALFEAGLVAYESERFESALMYFQRSLTLSGRAKLHYNLGLTFERLGRGPEAIHSYTLYLQAMPATENREEVEKRIAALHAWVESHPETSAESASAPAHDVDRTAPAPARANAAQPKPAPVPALAKRRSGWALVASGAVLLAGGGVCLGLALNAKQSVEDAPQGSSWHAVEDEQARVFPLSVAGFSLLGAGALSAAVGGVLLFAHPTLQVEVAIAPRGLGVGGRF